ncbi:MAG TPA: hypothetical protein VHA56_09815 [Mucilaginibacter sp.]|nr:hypothetical protein [Mucilaginibacter sp.]
MKGTEAEPLIAVCIFLNPKARNKFQAFQFSKPALLFRSSSGRKGNELEPNRPLLFENEDYLLLLKDLLNAIDDMENSASGDL